MTDEHAPPSSSSMALSLSFAEVQHQLPAGVRLESHEGVTHLSVWIKGVAPAIAVPIGTAVLGGWTIATLFPEGSPTAALIALGVASAYGFVGFLFGKRRVTIDGATLRVRSAPLPLPGDGSVPIDQIDGLEVVVVGKRLGHITWRIDAICRGQRRHLVHDLSSEEQAMVLARYLAQEHRLAAPTGVTAMP